MAEGKGIVNVTPYSVYNTERLERTDPDNPNYVKFHIEDDINGKVDYENWETLFSFLDQQVCGIVDVSVDIDGAGKSIVDVGDIDLESLTAIVYDDVPEQLHPIAKFSLEAHLLKLLNEAKVIVFSFKKGASDGDVTKLSPE